MIDPLSESIPDAPTDSVAVGAFGALRFGLPSKGRLQTQTAEFLAEAGVTFVKSSIDREYAGALQGVEGIEIVFLQAGEMPERLAEGKIHLGVTGEDLVRERLRGWERKVALLKPLGFGHADLVVATPKCWIEHQAILERMRAGVVEIGEPHMAHIVDWIVGPRVRIQMAREVGERPRDDLRQNMVAALEVLVRRLMRHAEPTRDVAQAQLLDAVAGDNRQRLGDAVLAKISCSLRLAHSFRRSLTEGDVATSASYRRAPLSSAASASSQVSGG